MMLMMGPLFGYLGSVQQIFADIFNVPTLFAVYFAITAISMALASYVNSRIVERLGTRVVSHSALCAMLLVASLGLLIALSGHLPSMSDQASGGTCFVIMLWRHTGVDDRVTESDTSCDMPDGVFLHCGSCHNKLCKAYAEWSTYKKRAASSHGRSIRHGIRFR